MNEMNTIREFVIENFLFGEEDRLADDTSFLGSNIIDSTGMLELASFLEERYGISIADEDLIPENLDSLNNIGRYLDRKLNGGPIESGRPVMESQLSSLGPAPLESKVQSLESQASTLDHMDRPSTSH